MNTFVKHFVEKMIWILISQPFQRSVNWERGDKLALDQFFKTATGVRLLELLRQTVASNTFRAVYHDSVSENARARGMQDLLAIVHRLRSFPPEESLEPGEDVEPLPSEKNRFDSSRFAVNGGNTAIR
jgi:hypothetical protein